MSDSSDDMEAYSGVCEDHLDNSIERALYRIIKCDISEFNDETHMINYIKKIAKNLLLEMYR